jgi:hypothetical protein
VVRNTEGDLIYKEKLEELKLACKSAALSFDHFQKQQIASVINSTGYKEIKENLINDLKALDEKLNRYLADTYGLGTKTQWKSKKEKEKAYQDWKESHQPFHWLAEFYEIISKGGFDVVIGNPPYVSMNKIPYDLKYGDFSCGDLYGYVINRSLQILKKDARYGFIVMHNLAFSRNFSNVRSLMKGVAANGWFSFFARIPAGLFSGDVRVRNCIFLLEKKKIADERSFFTTRIHRWFSETREGLFDKLHYSRFTFTDIIPMFNDSILSKYFESSRGKTLEEYENKHTNNKLYFKQSAYNWAAISKKPAPCYDGKGKKIAQSKVGDISFKDGNIQTYLMLLLNGKLFFSYWLIYGDEFDVTKDDILSIKVPFDLLCEDDKAVLKQLAEEFVNDLNSTVQYKLNAGKKVGTYNTSKLWHITNQSDLVFLKYLCDNPQEVFQAVETHISQTVLTGKESGEMEEEE